MSKTRATKALLLWVASVGNIENSTNADILHPWF
jgi:hypothetical protein